MIWLTQKLLAQLFEVDVRTINEHLQNLLEKREILEEAVIRNFRITASDDKQYNTKHYNLDAIIAVGFRVNSERAIAFRAWAIDVLKKFAVHGYVLDKKRLENGTYSWEGLF